MSMRALFFRPFALLAIAAAAVPHAFADTYQTDVVFHSDGARFLAGNSYGDYIIQDAKQTCDIQGDSCFIVHMNGSTWTTASAPALPSDPLDIAAGPGCIASPAGFNGLQVCNNGFQFFSGATSPEQGLPSLYWGPSFTGPVDSGDIRFDSAIMTANGNLFYLNYSNDTLDTAINESTVLATTPEPGSFALLATGMLAVAGVARRRLA